MLPSALNEHALFSEAKKCSWLVYGQKMIGLKYFMQGFIAEGMYFPFRFVGNKE